MAISWPGSRPAVAQEPVQVSPADARVPSFVAADLHSFEPERTFGRAEFDGAIVRSGSWRAEGETYIGAVGESGNALLQLPGLHQDLSVTATFRCSQRCSPGILVRSSNSGDVTSGILYSFGEAALGAFRLTLDAGGRVTGRDTLRRSPSPYPASMLGFRAEYPGLGMLYSAELGARRDITPINVDGRWNRLEVHLVGNSLRGLANGASGPEAGLEAVSVTGSGLVGLYVSAEPGTEIRFQEVGLKPMDRKKALPKEVTASRFRKQELEAMFYSEAVTAADVDLDGHLDVISGPNIFMGPDFSVRQEVYVPRVYSATSYPDPLLSSAGDLTGDGYPDLLSTGEPGRPGFLYVNPGAEARRWDKFMVIPSVDNETAFLDDIDGDGALEYVYGDGGFLGYAEPGPDPTAMWTFHKVTEQGPWGAMYAHGLGSGDVDGDGRKDLVQAYGWWKQPADPTAVPWTYHPQVFGRWGMQQGGPGGGRAFVYDVNGDGLNDVVTSLEAHGFGLAWFEQHRSADGIITFEKHTIMDDFRHPNNGVVFAALHALSLADVDGDGLKDIVTGKRWWAHFGENPSDPDAFGPPVIYWFRLIREDGQVWFEPELVNNHTGVGTDMITADLNQDGLADILTASRFGTAVFISER